MLSTHHDPLPSVAPGFSAAAIGLLRWLARLAAPGPQPVPLAATLQRLHKADTIWVSRPQGRRIRCETGTLWLTFDGEPIDVVLEAGQTHLCVHASALSIHVLSSATVQVS